MSETNILEEIVTLVRGFFSTPVISGLSRLGVLDRMMTEPQFAVEDFSNIQNKKLLGDSFRYIARLGLVECINEKRNIFKISELGKQVFQRSSSFYVPHSYGEYMHCYYDELLKPNGDGLKKVERLENVIGSGKTHQRYFPPAISFLKRRVQVEWVADIGCGDGVFLNMVLKSIPDKRVVGIDNSEVAINAARNNLHKEHPHLEIQTICTDAQHVEGWAEKLRDIVGKESVAISMWYLIHEISHNNPDRVVAFIKRIHQFFPQAPLVIGEIVRQQDNLLAGTRRMNIMPEYLFFHDFSGQGVLSWQEYQTVLEKIPYILRSERLFDEISDANEDQIPSAFVWCLIPR